jgi:hypothetical protein
MHQPAVSCVCLQGAVDQELMELRRVRAAKPPAQEKEYHMKGDAK